LNFDETFLKIEPGRHRTYEKKGRKQVCVRGAKDKRGITLMATITHSGDLLPPQLIYKGKTNNCHPKVNFPDG